MEPGGEATLTWLVAATDGQDHFVLAQVDSNAASGWTLVVEPEHQNVAAGTTEPFSVRATPDGAPRPEVLEVQITFRDATTGTQTTANGTITAEGFGLVLGRWDNPLPPPANGMWGLFALNVLAWTVVAFVVMVLLNPTLKLLTLRTKTTLDDRVIRIIARPAFVLILAFGIKQSVEVFPLPAWAFQGLDGAWRVLLVAVLVLVVYRLWSEVVLSVGKRMAQKTDSQLDDRLLPVFEKMGGIVILVGGLFYLLDAFGVNTAYFAAGGALVSLVIAFAAQDTLSNFFAGLHLLLDRPFKEGDDIILDSGEVTTVRDIGLRSTKLYHPANHEIIVVPNSILATNRVINLLEPDDLYKVKITVGVAYGSDLQRVKQVLLDIARSHPLSLDDEDHQPFFRLNNFGDSSIDVALHVWIGDVYARWAVASDLREMIDQRFAQDGIEIPFPQRVVWHGKESEPQRSGKPLELHGSVEEARKHLDSDDGP